MNPPFCRLPVAVMLCACQAGEHPKGSYAPPTQELAIYIDGSLRAEGQAEMKLSVVHAASDRCMSNRSFGSSHWAVAVKAPFSSLEVGKRSLASPTNNFPVAMWREDGDTGGVEDPLWYLWTGTFELLMDSEEFVQIGLIEGYICSKFLSDSYAEAVCEDSPATGLVEIRGAFFRDAPGGDSESSSGYFDVETGGELCGSSG